MYVCPLVTKVVGFGQTVVNFEVITVVVMRASLKGVVVLDVVLSADKDAVASGDDDGAVLCSSLGLLEFVE